MVRFGVTTADIKDAIGCTERTARNKANGQTPFTIGEAIIVRDRLFPGLRLEYLFAQDSIGEGGDNSGGEEHRN